MSYERILSSIQGRRSMPSRDDWEVADEEGWTIAHYWTLHHKPGKNFPHWALADNRGWTVAHSAASVGNLAEDFNAWGLKDEKGDTVAHIAIRSGNDLGYSKNYFTPEILAYINNEGVSVEKEISLRDTERFDNLKRLLQS